jgi:hypothetical protein
MSKSITIDARWDGESAVWLATSEDVHGLVVEAEDWSAMIDEVRLVLPELLTLEGEVKNEFSLTFRKPSDDVR